jgi:hypothetical protein
MPIARLALLTALAAGLPRLLAQPKSKRGRRQRNGRREPAIPNRTPIHQRPTKAHLRSQFGHWEGDLMHFRRQRDILLTLQERKSRLTLGRRLRATLAGISSRATRSSLLACGIMVWCPLLRYRACFEHSRTDRISSFRRGWEDLVAVLPVRPTYPRRFHLVRGRGGDRSKRAEVAAPETAHKGNPSRSHGLRLSCAARIDRATFGASGTKSGTGH